MSSNHLINETSPYLLQHAHNPVDWYPWGEEALERSRNEDKPILLSIGYAACHWCHVMERESFENEEVAAYMNEHFINIKIDREERPDLDHIYMDAVQTMTGSGGWPLNVFLTPSTRPFFGGTYFPPARAFNRSSWMETLEAVVQAFSQRRNEMDAQADNLTTHLIESGSFGLELDNELANDHKTLHGIYQGLMKIADLEWGGFGKAPKFPQTFSLIFLLRHAWINKETPAFDMATLSVDKMIEGGLYDQLGGGFSRYSTDREWLAPHFEKMLYDNALLLLLVAETFQLTGESRYMEIIRETMDFVQREMMHEQKGFYSALDADSEGVEGKFYTWSKSEIMKILGEKGEKFCEYYGVTEKGNWEHTNILHVSGAEYEGLEEDKEKMMKARSLRIRPSLDDKVILGWNALMNAAASKAFSVIGEESYRKLAVDNMHFLWKEFYDEEGDEFHHTWKNGEAKYPAFLDDLSLLAEALIRLQEITGDLSWLEKARKVMEMILRDFSDEESGLFYFTSRNQKDLIVRKKELYDGALPSGNAVMALLLHQLGICFENTEWRDRALRMLGLLEKLILKYPGSFGHWACVLQEVLTGTEEIVVSGADPVLLHEQMLSLYIPHRILVVACAGNTDLPLLKGRTGQGESSVSLCRNNTCYPSVFSTEELISLRNRLQKH